MHFCTCFAKANGPFRLPWPVASRVGRLLYLFWTGETKAAVPVRFSLRGARGEVPQERSDEELLPSHTSAGLFVEKLVLCNSGERGNFVI